MLVATFKIALQCILSSSQPAFTLSFVRSKSAAGPKAVWMLGNSMSFLGLGQIMNVEKFAQEYKNKPFALSFGARSAVMISDAENGR